MREYQKNRRSLLDEVTDTLLHCLYYFKLFCLIDNAKVMWQF